jgi:hypothetical protein
MAEIKADVLLPFQYMRGMQCIMVMLEGTLKRYFFASVLFHKSVPPLASGFEAKTNLIFFCICKNILKRTWISGV